MPQHLVFILFLFALGACIGSFLNVVVWRLPRGESLVSPPSRCPKCEHPLAWRDNIPVFGWIALGGKCRYCGNPISPRYPIVEAIVGALFVFYYVMFFIVQHGPCAAYVPAHTDIFGRTIETPRPLAIQQDWPIYALYMFGIAAMFAASLIDAETFTIPPSITWWMAGAGIVVHAIIDDRTVAGALNASPVACAMAAGGGVGLLLSIVLLRLGVLPLSFAEGGPLLEFEKEQLRQQQQSTTLPNDRPRDDEVPDYESQPPPPEYTPAQIRAEMRKEMLFLLPPMLLAAVWTLLVVKVPAIRGAWTSMTSPSWVSGALGAILGGLVGGFWVWVFRVFGSLAFGREAMGIGDADLMFGVGAILGAGGATMAFFIAPFFGMAVAVYRLVTRRGHELPFGPYLSMGAAFVMLFYCPLAAYLGPGLAGMGMIVRGWLGI